MCGLWQWRLHSCLLSPRAFFGVSFLMCPLLSVRTDVLQARGEGSGSAATSAGCRTERVSPVLRHDARTLRMLQDQNSAGR